MRGRALIVLAIALGLAGCGASSLSVSQLRTGAARICHLAEQQTGRIPTPRRSSDASRYLRGGVIALTPELTALDRLHPPADLSGEFREALRASTGEVRALRSALKGLDTGDDPVVAIKTLQQQLGPLEDRADHAWQAVGVTQCAAG